MAPERVYKVYELPSMLKEMTIQRDHLYGYLYVRSVISPDDILEIIKLTG